MNNLTNLDKVVGTDTRKRATLGHINFLVAAINALPGVSPASDIIMGNGKAIKTATGGNSIQLFEDGRTKLISSYNEITNIDGTSKIQVTTSIAVETTYFEVKVASTYFRVTDTRVHITGDTLFSNAVDINGNFSVNGGTTTISGGAFTYAGPSFSVNSGAFDINATVKFENVGVYEDNMQAGSIPVGTVYRTSTGVLKIKY